jgi:hypothetical protein
LLFREDAFIASLKKRTAVQTIISIMKYLSMTLIPLGDVDDNMLAVYILDYTVFPTDFLTTIMVFSKALSGQSIF